MLPEPALKPRAAPPQVWAEAMAYFKARAVAAIAADAWILGADTIVVCGGEILGKPRDLEGARRMLELQAGRETEVITGVALTALGAGRNRIIQHAVTKVWMLDAREEREAYLRGGEWSGKAGAYGIQDTGDRLVERIEGSFTNVVGLPLALVRRMLEIARIQSAAPPDDGGGKG